MTAVLLKKLFGTMPSVKAAFWGALALVLLLGLGTWQVQRLHWKLGLIATMKARMSAAAVPLPAGTKIDARSWAYRRVRLEGHYLNGKAMHLLAYETRSGTLGYDLVTPFLRADGEGAVLVNRGWVPRGQGGNAAPPKIGAVTGPVTVIGIVHPAWKGGLFTPRNEPGRGLWFAGDAAAMGATAGLQVPPLLVDRVAGPDPRALPIGGQTRVDLPNHHLQYAITWYLLALVLVVIFVRYHRNRAADEAARSNGPGTAGEGESG